MDPNEANIESFPVPTPRDWRKSLGAILEKKWFNFVMMLFTLWALFDNDVRLSSTTAAADTGFLVIVSIIFFVFALEIAITCICDPSYANIPSFRRQPYESLAACVLRCARIGSFYFWLDLVATASLIFEISWILPTESISSSSSSQAAHSSVRAARAVRLIRMVRLVRLIKLYKYFSMSHQKEDDANASDHNSKVGAAMSDITNRRVVVLVLSMLIIIPLLTVAPVDQSPTICTAMIHRMALLVQQNASEYQGGLDLAVASAFKYSSLPIVYLDLDGLGDPYFRDHDALSTLRPSIEAVVYSKTTNDITTTLIFNQKLLSTRSARFSMYTTLFIMFLLMAGTYFFSSDVSKLVIRPIECMVELVRKISENPLGVEYKMLGEEDGFMEGMETTILLATITKIGALMRVGFGEAGAAVIARNLADSAGGKLNLMGGGIMIRSIFGFCDVRQFTDTTECLQEEVMLFVNRIAHILHGIVVQCSGAANKNIGDAFLLTWKLNEKLDDESTSKMADQALLAFCKTLVELNRYEEFICNFSMAATARLFKRFPNYHVRIGCGLHVGWAIEGAIGSNRKIDASYLSPHVNFTEFLESSTKQYGVPMLLSEQFFQLLSPHATKYCRQVDRVRRSEAEEPLGLYTYDADLDIDFSDVYRRRPTLSANKPMNSFKNVARKIVDQRRRSVALNPLPAMQSAIESANANTNTSAEEKSDPAPPPTPPTATASAATASAATARMSTSACAAAKRSSVMHAKRGSVVVRPSDVSMMEAVAAAVLEDQRRTEREDDRGDEERGEGKLKNSRRDAPTITLAPYHYSVWETDSDLVDLRYRVSDACRELWAEGIEAYIAGGDRWTRAKQIFTETNRLAGGKDGPSKFLLSVMKAAMEKKQEGSWKGYRDCDDGH